MLLATKLKNEIKKKNPNLVCELKNININGRKTGCSGFITNPKNNSVVYVNTEPNFGDIGYLYRYARDNKDYSGYNNHYAKPTDAFVNAVCLALKFTPEQKGEVHL